MGPSEGEPFIYHWPIYYHAMPLLLLLILAALLFRKPNRRLGAVWVLLPTLILLLLSTWLVARSDILQSFSFLLDSVLLFFFAMGCLWLLADKLGKMQPMAAFGCAVLVLIVAGVVGLLGVSGLSVGLILIPIWFVYGCLVAAALFAISLAGVACRKQYSPPRYLLWLFLICVVGIGGALTLFVGLLLLAFSLTMDYFLLSDVVTGALTTGSVVGLAIFVLVLIFMAAAIFSKAYRPRFHAIFRLPGMDFEQDPLNSDVSMEDDES